MTKGSIKKRQLPPTISVVAPAFNEAENFQLLCDKVFEVLDPLEADCELLIVENGSTDGSLDLLKEMSQRIKGLRYLSLTRNFGHQGALIAGLENARGDIVISMDADLQHPPDVIPSMLQAWQEGNDIVFTLKRADPNQTLIRGLINRVFYGTLTRVSGLELAGGQSDFRLMDRCAVDVLTAMPENSKFLRGLTRWMGYQHESVEYDVPPRNAGESKFRLGQLCSFAVDGMLSFSILPLRIFTLFGGMVSLIAFLYGAYVISSGAYAYFSGYQGRVPPGWASITAAVSFFGGVQLLGVGLLGEYLGRVYDQVKSRPAYVIREQSHPDIETE